LSLKSTRLARLQSLSTFCEQGRKEERRQQRIAERLVEDKQKRFASMPEQEQENLRMAFEKYRACSSGSEEYGESFALCEALGELGICAKSQMEQRELERLCHEICGEPGGDSGEPGLGSGLDFFGFCFDLLPRVRKRFCELHQGSLLHEFNCYDKDRSGHLDDEECRQLLETFCTGNLDVGGLREMQVVFGSLMEQEASRSTSRGKVDFNVFQHLVGRAREHHQRIIRASISVIKRNHLLDDGDMQQHWDEVVLLHEGFLNADGNGDRELEWDETVTALIEHGLFPHDVAARVQVLRIFKQVDANLDGHIGFREYLQLVRSVRRAQMQREEQSLREMFQRLDKDQSSRLDITEISTLLGELGIQPRCHEDQWEIRRLLDDIDSDRSGDFSFEKFAALIQRLQGRLASAVRRRQQLLAFKLGLDGRQLTELRILFFDLDREARGFLTASEQREAIHRLQANSDSNTENSWLCQNEHLAKVAAEIDAASATGVGRVDFQGFLQRFATAAPRKSDANSEVLSANTAL
jgi:Ca2+-binding EF-hand superfamily protein